MQVDLIEVDLIIDNINEELLNIFSEIFKLLGVFGVIIILLLFSRLAFSFIKKIL